MPSCCTAMPTSWLTFWARILTILWRVQAAVRPQLQQQWHQQIHFQLQRSVHQLMQQQLQNQLRQDIPSAVAPALPKAVQVPPAFAQAGQVAPASAPHVPVAPAVPPLADPLAGTAAKSSMTRPPVTLASSRAEKKLEAARLGLTRRQFETQILGAASRASSCNPDQVAKRQWHNKVSPEMMGSSQPEKKSSMAMVRIGLVMWGRWCCGGPRSI